MLDNAYVSEGVKVSVERYREVQAAIDTKRKVSGALGSSLRGSRGPGPGLPLPWIGGHRLRGNSVPTTHGPFVITFVQIVER